MAGGALTLSSTLNVSPPAGAPDAGSGYVFQATVSQTLTAWINTYYQLSNTTPVSVNFGSIALSNGATCIRVLTDNGPIVVELTTADGTLQALPVDAGGLLEWACISVPVTAVTLVGPTGQICNVTVFLGTTQTI